MDRPVMEFIGKQLDAIQACCDVTNRIAAVTGPAGTGKTSLMKAVHSNLTEAGYSVACATPTGKAAKRVQEATGIPASTGHRLLKFSYPGERDEKTGKVLGVSLPRHDRQNPMPYDCVLVDEYAMVNHELHRSIIDALKPGGRLCVFGDVNQLPPIEQAEINKKKATPFTELLNKFRGVRLDHNFRQEEGSDIAGLGMSILNGKYQEVLKYIRGDRETSGTITDRPTEALKQYVLESGIDFATIRNQVIVPMNKSWCGTHKLNALLKQFIGPESDMCMELPRHQWDAANAVIINVGDKVIYNVNCYDIRPFSDQYEPDEDAEDGRKFVPPSPHHQIFNGETGIVTDISDFGEITIDLGDRSVMLPPEIQYEAKDGGTRSFDPRRDLFLAYAITTHKSQGSEYDNTVYLLNKSTKYAQNRPNFYTAVTRARKHCHIITDQPSLTHSVWKKDA